MHRVGAEFLPGQCISFDVLCHFTVEKKDRDAVILLRMRRANLALNTEVDEDVEDGIDEEDGREHMKNRKEKENRETWWYIG